MRNLILVLLGIMAIVISAGAQAASSVTEQYERDVDQVALAAQGQAISKLGGLLKKYRGTSQEPVLLARLADLQQQRAAILFRIAHGRAHRGKAGLDLTAYRAAMKEAIETCTQLIKKYPVMPEIAHVYFLRGKGFEEIEDKAAAARDYLELVTKHSESEETYRAYMSLAEFAIEANDHPKAIGFLKKVEAAPEDPHYPFALYKLAWSHYNLKKVPEALAYLERHLAFYATAVGSDAALRESSLLDSTVFFLQGYEDKLPRYALSDALQYFRKLDGGPVLGKLASRFAKLLRSHGHEADLISWKDQLLAEEPQRSETLDTLLITFENQFNHRRFDQLVDSAKDLVRLQGSAKGFRQFESYPRAQKLFLDTAETIQALVVKNKDATEVSSLSVTLAAIYHAFTQVVDERDSRIPKVHFNLAETLFAIRAFGPATEHYRWVVDHSSWKDPAVAQSSLRAIASQYEVLRQKKRIPEHLEAKATVADDDVSDDRIAADLTQWISWVDTHVARTRDQIGGFSFEANRALYSQGQRRRASRRMAAFAEGNPASPYAVPSISLVIDTLIAGADWERAHELSSRLLTLPSWKEGAFAERLFVVASDSYYKMIEDLHRRGEFKEVVDRSDHFLQRYARSARLPDCLALAGDSALTLNQKDRAIVFFSRLIEDAPQAEAAGAALLSRAALEEERYQFASAARDYRQFLDLPPLARGKAGEHLPAARKKTLLLNWLSGDMASLRANTGDSRICEGDELSDLCERYQAWIGLQEKVSADEAFAKARKTKGSARALWAAAALEGAKSLGFKDRLMATEILATSWEDLDPLFRVALIPAISESVPKAFRLSRAGLSEVAPLRSEERAIKRRVEAIKEVESAATRAVKLPWARIRATVLNSVAFLYIDLARGLSELPAPKGLSTQDVAQYEDTIRQLALPFEEKGQDIRRKAFEIASRASIEDDAFVGISEEYFRDNPSQAKALRVSQRFEAPAAMDRRFLATLDSSSGWEDLETEKDREKALKKHDPVLGLEAMLLTALEARRWPQVAFFMNQAQEKAYFQPAALALIRSVCLSVIGARGEGLAELELAGKEFEPRAQARVKMHLISHYLVSLSKERVKELSQDVDPALLRGDELEVLGIAIEWSGLRPKVGDRAVAGVKGPLNNK